MFLLNFIPTWLLGFSVNIIIIAGGISFVVSLFLESFARYVPWVAPHKTLLQVLGILLLVLGVYLKGAADMEVKWRDRVTKMEVKVALAEAESKIANSKVQIKVVEKIRYVKEKQIVIEQKIEEAKAIIDSTCKVTPEVIDIHNAAAKTPEAEK